MTRTALTKKTIQAIIALMMLSNVHADEFYDCQALVVARSDETQERASIEHFRIREEQSGRHGLTIIDKTQLVLQLDANEGNGSNLSHDTQFHNDQWDIVYRKALGAHVSSIHFNFDKKTGKIMYKAVTANDSVSANGKCVRNLRLKAVN